jgi:hypothetical protein
MPLFVLAYEMITRRLGRVMNLHRENSKKKKKKKKKEEEEF